MADTVTIVGSLAHLDLTAYRDAKIRIDVYSAPSGSAIETSAAPGVTAPAEYVPTAYVGSRVVVTDDQGLWGAELPWQDGAVLRVTVPGDGAWFAVLGTGAGKIAAGVTVNYRDLTPPAELVAPSSSLDALVAAIVADYLTSHPAAGATDHGALTGLGDDDHPQYLTAARGDARYVLPGSLTLTNLAAGGTSPVRRLRAASNGSLSWVEPLFARKAADQQYLNTAALADVTDLGIDLEADSVYVGSAQITYSTGATSVKCNLGWTLPAGATMSWAANGISSAATTVAAAISRTNLTGAQPQSVGSAGASAIDALPTFIIMTGATAGRLQLQAAQGTADAVNALTIKANSWVRAERVV